MSEVRISLERPEAETDEDFYGYAGFWKRLIAFLIDWLVLGLLLAAFGVLLTGSTAVTGMVEQSAGLLELAGIILPWLYYAGMECSEHQATPGKLALNIRVTDLEGRRIGFLRATVRHFTKILSGMLLLIGYIMIAFTAKRQGLHDLIAGCLVVNRI